MRPSKRRSADISDDNITFVRSEDFDFIDGKEQLRSDYFVSKFIVNDKRAFNHFERCVEEYLPDIIIIERFWIWPALERYIKTRRSRHCLFVVYAPQNVGHWLLKNEDKNFLNDQERNIYNDDARRCEINLVFNSDMIVAVSRKDAEFFLQENSNVIIVPNGISPKPELGYEAYLNFSNISVVGTLEVARLELRKMLSSSNVTRQYIVPTELDKSLSRLLWSNCLTLIVDQIKIGSRSKFLHLNETITPGVGLEQALYSGWHPCEKNWVWGSHRVSTIRLKLSIQSDSHDYLRLRITAYARHDAMQTIEFFVGPRMAGVLFLSKGESIDVCVTMTDSDIVDDGFLNISMHCSEICSPLEVGESPDPRPLSIQLWSVSLTRDTSQAYLLDPSITT